MIETKIKGSHTEIYVGGGNFITQAYPTNHHEFWKKRYLTADESIDDYKEVTAAQKATIEAADAKWEEPDAELKAEASSVGIVYNDNTGYFEYNELRDISSIQLRHIINNYGRMKTIGRLPDEEARTNIAERVFSSYNPNPNYGFNLYNKFLRFSKIEVIVLAPGEEVWPINIDRAFSGCLKLKKIIGTIRLTDYLNLYKSKSTASAFEDCRALEEVRLKVDGKTVEQVGFSGCPRLSIASIEFLVSNSANITITLHPDAYARLTDELIEKASARQITFATTQ